MGVPIVKPSAVNRHNTSSAESKPQFRRSNFPGINVELSGSRVNAPSDPEQLNKKFNCRRGTAHSRNALYYLEIVSLTRKPNQLPISCLISRLFTARQHSVSIACYAKRCISYRKSARLSVSPSARQSLALCQNDSSYDHGIFTVG